MQIFCGNESNATSYDLTSFNPNSSNTEYIPVWPYLDIHIQPDTVVTCDLSAYTFNCKFFTRDLTEIGVTWIGEAHQSTKVLTYRGHSKIFIFNPGSQPKILYFCEKVYAVAQNGYKVFIWAENGLYGYIRNIDGYETTFHNSVLTF